MMPKTKRRQQGDQYSIDGEKFVEIQRQSRYDAGLMVEHLLDTDWDDGDHQNWLDTESVDNIIIWLDRMVR